MVVEISVNIWIHRAVRIPLLHRYVLTNLIQRSITIERAICLVPDSASLYDMMEEQGLQRGL